jgi:hypothetical protein
VWFWDLGLGDNRLMELTQEQIDRLEAALASLEALDPSEVPEPAAELADLLGAILEESEAN